MKLLLVSLIVLSSINAFAGICVPGKEILSRCDIQVTGSRLAECRGPGPIRPNGSYRTPNYPGNYPGSSFPETYSIPWRRVDIGEEASACDLSLEDCKYFAFRKLEKFQYTNNCGAVSVGKSVEYVFRSLNNDGTIAEEVLGRMSK